MDVETTPAVAPVAVPAVPGKKSPQSFSELSLEELEEVLSMLNGMIAYYKWQPPQNFQFEKVN